MSIEPETQIMAENMTRDVQTTINKYDQIRFTFNVIDSRSYFYYLYDRNKQDVDGLKYPSKHKIRKVAGVSFWEDKFATKYNGEKAKIDDKLEKAKATLTEQINNERDARQRYNEGLSKHLDIEYSKLLNCDCEAVIGYFNFVIDINKNSLFDIINNYDPFFQLGYYPEFKRLIVDYSFPLLEMIPDIKGFRATKENTIKEEKMNTTEHLFVYERMIFDLAVRMIGLLFSSDNENVLNDIVFNGYCQYYVDVTPICILSFMINKTAYSFEKVRNISFISKKELSTLKGIQYIGDIKSDKPSSILKEKSPAPSKRITPIQSSLLYL